MSSPDQQPSTIIPESLCPRCKAKLNRASSINAPYAEPRPGDTTLCIGCGILLVFTAEQRLRRSTEEEFTRVVRFDPRMWAMSQFLGARLN